MALPARDETREQLSDHEPRLQRIEEIVGRTEGAVRDLQADVQRIEKLLLSLCKHVGMEVLAARGESPRCIRAAIHPA